MAKAPVEVDRDHVSTPALLGTSAADEAELDSAVRASLDRIHANRRLYRELAGLFLKTFPAQAVDLRSSLANGDADRARLTAHRIKGSASIVGACGVQEAARQIELCVIEGDLARAAASLAAFGEGFDAFERHVSRSGLVGGGGAELDGGQAATPCGADGPQEPEP